MAAAPFNLHPVRYWAHSEIMGLSRYMPVPHFCVYCLVMELSTGYASPTFLCVLSCDGTVHGICLSHISVCTVLWWHCPRNKIIVQLGSFIDFTFLNVLNSGLKQVKLLEGVITQNLRKYMFQISEGLQICKYTNLNLKSLKGCYKWFIYMFTIFEISNITHTAIAICCL
jgi:hypothetical protein